MKARKGASIVLILIMVMLLSILGTQVLVTLNSETKANMNKVDDTQAAYVAQAMAESFAVYVKEQTQENVLNLYKLAKKNGLVLAKDSGIDRMDDKFYTVIEVKASDLKKITESGNLKVEESEFQDFKAEGIIKFYDLSEDNVGIPKNADPTKIDSSKIKKVRARAEGWFNKGTKENPDYVVHGINLYFNYDVGNESLYGNESASIIVKKNLFMDKGVKPVETGKDENGNPTKVVFRIKHPLGTGTADKIKELEQNLGLSTGQIEVVNKDNDYYNFKFPIVTNFDKKRKELIDAGKDKVTIGGVKIDTKDKIIVNKIAEYFDSTRGIIWNLAEARKVSDNEGNLNGTSFDGTYYGGSKWLKTKPALSIGEEINGQKGLTSGVYRKLRSKNNAMSSYDFSVHNPKNYFSSRSIVIHTQKDKITEIVLDELDIETPIFVNGEGLVHFYVKDRVRIGNLSTLYTESFIFEKPLSDEKTDEKLISSEAEFIVTPNKEETIHFKNNISRVTIFYEGTDPVVLSGTIENSVNIVAPNADIVLSPTVGQSIITKNKNMTFKGVLMSGQDINMNFGKIGLTVGDSFKYRIKGLFYAPYGDITVNAKKPAVIAGTMIAENISMKCPDNWSIGESIKIKTGYEYSYKELSDRGIGLTVKSFHLAFMENM